MKILMIIAKQGFQDQEFQKPYDIFQEHNLIVDIASTEKGDCIGKFGLQVVADRSLEDVDIEEYFAVVLIGGPGSVSLVGNPELEKIVQTAKEKNIVIAAICYAPVILAKAEVLKGKKATVWNNDGKQGPILEEAGVDFVDEMVVVDDMLVTANGPAAADAFGHAVVKAVECSDCWIKETADKRTD